MADNGSAVVAPDPVRRLTTVMWLALAAAFLGWMFDGMEMGIYSIVIRPALTELVPQGAHDKIPLFMSVTLSLFLTGMAAGGLLFGRLGDRIGRVKTMAIAILVYAVFTGLSGFATRWEHIAVCRFLGAMGLGGEWGLGVALVVETWPNASRPLLAGILGAAANFGFLASSGIAWIAKAQGWGWREPLWCGVVPALLVFFLRLTVKEPEKFVRSQERGERSRLADLFAGDLRRKTLIGSGLGGVAVLGMWGAWQYWLPSWAPDLAVPSLQAITQAEALVKTIEGGSPSPSQVAHVAAAASKAAAAAGQAAALTGSGRDQARAAQAAAFLAAARAEGGAGAATEVLDSIRETVKACQAVVKGAQGVARAATMQWMAIGSIVGAILGGLIGDWLGRRRSYALLCLCSIAVALPLYFTVHEFGTRFIVLTCLSGIPITAFFGWLPLYLPELYPTRLRATGEGFCFNVGRVISAVGVFGTGILAKSIGIPHAAAYMSAIFLLGLPLIALAPETKGEELPE